MTSFPVYITAWKSVVQWVYRECKAWLIYSLTTDRQPVILDKKSLKQESFDSSRHKTAENNIPSALAYGVYVSILVHYNRGTILNIKTLLLTIKLLSQGYRRARLVSRVLKVYGRHHYLLDPYIMAFSKLISHLMASVEA